MIYAIQCGESGPIKLGRAANPLKRLAELQVAHHEKLFLRASQKTTNDELCERWMHEHCASASIRGEWFRPAPIVLELIEDMKLSVADTKVTKAYSKRIVEAYRAHMRKYHLLQLFFMLKRLTRVQRPAHGSA